MNTMNRNTIQTMKRAALQRLAKENGVRAVGPDEQIRTALLELFAGSASTSCRDSNGPTAEEGKNPGVLQDVKNRVDEGGPQLKDTGTRRSARLTVTKTASAVTLKADREKVGPEPQRDGGHKPSRKVLGPQARSSDLDEFRVKFDGALTLAGLKLGIRVCGVKPSATDLSRKRKRNVDAAEPPSEAQRPSLKRRTRRIQRS